MVTVICVKCRNTEEIELAELGKRFDLEKLDKVARLGLKSGLLRIVCRDCKGA